MEWADRLDLPLHVLHVLEGHGPEGGVVVSKTGEDEILEHMRVEVALNRSLLRKPHNAATPDVHTAVLHHWSAANGILEYVDEHEIDLVIMAPYGSRQGERFVVDGTAEKVVRLAPCDVFTIGVRGLNRRPIPARILVPVDFSAASAAAVRRARELAARSHARLTVLHVIEPHLYPGEARGTLDLRTPVSDEQAFHRLRDFYRSAGGPSVARFFWTMRGRPAPEIVTYADRAGIDLIVQGSHGREGLEYAVLGSVAEEVVRRASCPVLTMKNVRHATRRAEGRTDSVADTAGFRVSEIKRELTSME